VNISYGPYFQEGPAEDVFKAAIATGHEIHADVQDLHKDIRGLKGVGVFSVRIDPIDNHPTPTMLNYLRRNGQNIFLPMANVRTLLTPTFTY
jgi:hypothetical protein